jgi:hypothetical protein
MIAPASLIVCVCVCMCECVCAVYPWEILTARVWWQHSDHLLESEKRLVIRTNLETSYLETDSIPRWFYKMMSVRITCHFSWKIFIWDNVDVLWCHTTLSPFFHLRHDHGWMAEWSKALVLGTSLRAWVRIPLQSVVFVFRSGRKLISFFLPIVSVTLHTTKSNCCRVPVSDSVWNSCTVKNYSPPFPSDQPIVSFRL